jgi:hypothetical protein
MHSTRVGGISMGKFALSKFAGEFQGGQKHIVNLGEFERNNYVDTAVLYVYSITLLYVGIIIIQGHRVQ